MKTEKKVEENWNEFWKEILLKNDGSIDIEQLKKELFDFSTLLDNVPKVYNHITGGMLSKVNTKSELIIKKADQYYKGLNEEENDERELEAKTDRNMNLISAFCEHLKNEASIDIPESAVLSFFNA